MPFLPPNQQRQSTEGTVSKLNQLKKIFTGRFLGKYVVKRILKIPPHLAYIATLACETLMSAKEAINDKLQGSVAAYLRCCGVVNQVKKGLLFSLSEKKLKSGIFGKVTSKDVVVSCTGQHTAKRQTNSSTSANSYSNQLMCIEVIVSFF